MRNTAFGETQHGRGCRFQLSFCIFFFKFSVSTWLRSAQISV